jgi:hypothetical protein
MTILAEQDSQTVRLLRFYIHSRHIATHVSNTLILMFHIKTLIRTLVSQLSFKKKKKKLALQELEVPEDLEV